MTDTWDNYVKNWENDKADELYPDNTFNLLIKKHKIKTLRILNFGCGTVLLSKKLSPAAKEIVMLDSIHLQK